MKLTMNITTCYEDTDRYHDRADLQQYFKGFGLDGLEVLEAGPDEKGLIHADDTIGVHLRYYAGWMDFWTENLQRLQEEFQTKDAWVETYGGETPDTLTEAYRKNIRFANTLKPEYLVFHVSDTPSLSAMPSPSPS